MSKVMKTTALPELFARIAGEYRTKGSIYEIPESCFSEAFALEAASPGITVMSGRVSLPAGPAAGPHSQIAPNLVAAYLAGSRVFELKTVQENDHLEIDKPCIEALDEGHNVEWSTELSLTEAREEYLRGWIAINLLAAIFSEKPRDFIFNMSVGYTLEGIKGTKVNTYIEGMRNPARSAFWFQSMKETRTFVESELFVGAFGEAAQARALSLCESFPAKPVHSVTLSTMHGCPPAEIERIGRYLLEDKGFDTYVKLNPTLVGYHTARSILDGLGWTDISLKRESFDHDLQFDDALSIISALREVAEESGRHFGIKLSNTLANANTGSFLPGAERYMSGRSLFPITTELAARLARAIPDFESRFSYCGGVSALNARDLVHAGMAPLTIATDILKPGGYQRLLAVAREEVAALHDAPRVADAQALTELAAKARTAPEYRKDWKEGKASIDRELPLYDCFAAPCIEACPVHQKVPAYLAAAGCGNTEEALATILTDNPLPHITGVLCDHVCQEHCSRVDYEGPVRIRDVKLVCARAQKIPDSDSAIAMRLGSKDLESARAAGPVAIIGAGPAGLACAHHLALAGVSVTVFDSSAKPGGVPVNVIPGFRISREDTAADIDRIEALGVKFRFGEHIRDASALGSEGFGAVVLAVGAESARKLGIEAAGLREVDALEFLGRLAREPEAYNGVTRVVVAGGGNTAMDAVRAATRIAGVELVLLSYRRTVAEMPADREELANAMAESRVLAQSRGLSGLPEMPGASGAVGVPGADRQTSTFLELTVPVGALPADPAGSSGGATAPARLKLEKMFLGERDASGRRSPQPSGKYMEVECDLLVSAIGESPDRELLEAFGVQVGSQGRPAVESTTLRAGTALYVAGDARRGPASIISAEADGKAVARAILEAAGLKPPVSGYAAPEPRKDKLAARGNILSSLSPEDPAFAAREAERCLACDSACLRCVEVCPNRANAFVAAGKPFVQSMQIVHIDRLCNECGNCGLFCPWQGEPFRGKPTLFDTVPEMAASGNAGFVFVNPGVPDGVGETAPAGEPGPSHAGSGSAGLPASQPLLAVKTAPGQEIRYYSYGEWNGASLPAAAASMTALARAVWRDHRYLAGGRP